ncbi:branched-chain amino acid aminotransferase [Blastomyces dermatitidis ER-3]|uniref:Branched-chain-amino-acid aminotransferase n=3 Tax=Blastomyces TaxID=229219 RepID=A0A179UMS1_BLAGS|nr:branched-chain amino acid aminotransferase [Blastomyces gilchristii SLH14081]XP_045271708.1 branched-chain amino acid aminotransferase [Blastomyces dermatitidis ER-3]EGE85126.2 branched-chain amino acid aminotransferase [Blastomyces dermatitidis ATCC 18188]EQL31894.1 branched-chain amino acid aminotransferase [Blastomyces dermatitidis ATCC 26199]EEQ83536.2 branched-chain amino acid aminotransferase [Blastomyces dermatitidis ER-3]OAT08509.1 branched-chain amino acid aminotransferase [Blastom
MKSALYSTTRRGIPALSGSSSAWRYSIPCQRKFSTDFASRSDGLPGIDVSKLSITKTTSPKQPIQPEKLVFGNTFTDHMLTINWNTKDGWLAPKIIPFQNLSLNPATCVFHYAFECFEGMKAYKDKNGGIRLFRPDKNMSRLNKSSKRIALPTLDADAAIKLIGELVKLDSRFIPDARGYSLYLRPTMIGTQETLGVSAPSSAMLFVIASPVGPYYPTGFKAVSLEATDYAVRAWPGGVGDKKLGANYAPCIVPQIEAAKKGHQQNLWLFGDEEYVTEVGTMNLFVALKNKGTGQNELITAPLDGTILEGVTRDSVLALARERLGPKGWAISERKLTMSEIAQAADEGRMIEVFGAGTAAIVSPVRTISWKGRTVDCGLKENEEAGKVALEMKNWIEGIQYGDEEHSWSVKL